MSAKYCFRVLFAFVLFFGLFASTKPANAAVLYDSSCPNAPARLKPGDIAVVSDKGGPNGLNLRVQPALGQQIIMSIPLYERVTIIAGPKCQDGYRWFEVGYNGQDGWSAEVGSDGVYNLDPNSPPTTQSGQSQGGLQQQTNSWPDNLIGTWENQMACPSNPNNNCDVRVEIARDSSGQLQISVYENSVLVGTGVQQTTQGCGSGPGMCSPEYVFTGNYIVSLPDRGPVLDFYNSNGWLGELNYSGPPPQVQSQAPTQTTPQQEAGTNQIQSDPNLPEQTNPSIADQIVELITTILGGKTVDAGLRCEPQCMVEAQTIRKDMCDGTWITCDGSTDPMDVLAAAKNSSLVRVRSANEAPKVDDLVIWPADVLGKDNKTGHIGVITAVNGTTITIHDANWKYDCKTRDITISIPKYLVFISKPGDAQQNSIQTPAQQATGNKCSHPSGWLIPWCALPWNWNK